MDAPQQKKSVCFRELPVTHGPYTITRFLGSGGQGEVYEAYGPSDGADSAHRPLALKVFPNTTSVSARHSVRDQWELGRLCHHPHIAEMYGRGGVNGMPYIAMELAEGMDLDMILRHSGQTLPPTAVIEVGLCVAEALEYLHNLCDESGQPLSVIYQDVKPGNIIVGPHGTLKLVDFGVTRFRGRLGGPTAGQTEGTLPFYSPEQATARTADLRSDIFTFGSLLYTLLTGCSPFAHKEPSMWVILCNIARCNARGPREVRQRSVTDFCPELWPVINQCHQRSPRDRPQNMAEVHGLLLGLLSPHGRDESRGVFRRWAERTIAPLLQVRDNNAA